MCREKGGHRILRQDAQGRSLTVDLARAAKHPGNEPRPAGMHRQRPDIRALRTHRGTALFDNTISHKLKSPTLGIVLLPRVSQFSSRT